MTREHRLDACERYRCRREAVCARLLYAAHVRGDVEGVAKQVVDVSDDERLRGPLWRLASRETFGFERHRTRGERKRGRNTSGVTLRARSPAMWITYRLTRGDSSSHRLDRRCTTHLCLRCHTRAETLNRLTERSSQVPTAKRAAERRLVIRTRPQLASQHLLRRPHQWGGYSNRAHTSLSVDIDRSTRQAVLASHRNGPEKQRRHNHYLRSTVFATDARADSSSPASRGRAASTTTFLCLGRHQKRNNLRPPVHLRADSRDASPNTTPPSNSAM